jgi:iron complex outermembrane recepter protein
MTPNATLPNRPLAAGIALAVSLGLLSSPNAAAISIEEIVVTAQKREESISDVPIAISAFSGEQLKTFRITDTRQLELLVPGFKVGDSGFNTPIYTMRGVGFNETTYSAQPNVSIYVDEFNMPYNIMTKGLTHDLQRVEVLKGPQGILYGRNTTGGAINYIANKPTEEFEAGISLGYGSYETTDVEGFVSGKISENLLGRVSIRNMRSFKGNQKSITRPDDRLGEKDKTAIRGILDWNASEDLLVRLMVDAWRDKSDPRAAQGWVLLPQVAANLQYVPNHLAFPFGSRSFADDPTRGDWGTAFDWGLNDKQIMVGLRTEWDITDSTKFTALGSYLKLKSDGSTYPQNGVNYTHNDQTIYAEMETLSFEARLSGTSGQNDQFEWMIGGNVSHDDIQEFRDFWLDNNSSLVDTFSNFLIRPADVLAGIVPPGTFNQVVTDPQQQFDNAQVTQYSAFANGSWHFTDKWTFTLGTRYTKQEQDFHYCNREGLESTGGTLTNGVTLSSFFGQPKGVCFVFLDPAPISGNGSIDDSLDENNTSFRAAIDFKPNDDHMLYASAGRGYKSGGFPNVGASQERQLAPVLQERVLAFEVGAKSYWFARQLQTNVAIYDYDYKNKQLFTKFLDPLFGPLAFLDNAPKSTVRGLEFDFKFAPEAIEGLFIGGTYAYTDTEVDEFLGLNFRGQPEDFAGQEFNFAPKIQYTLMANYTHSINESMNWFIGADYYWSDDTNAVLEHAPQFEFESYGLIGAQFGVASADERWKVTVYGRNLDDEVQQTGAVQSGDVVARFLGEGRFIGITFDYNFTN